MSDRTEVRRSITYRVPPTHSKSDDSHRAEARRHQSRSVLRSSSTPEPSGPLSPVELFFTKLIDCFDTLCYKNETGMIRPQVPLRQPCYDFSFLQTGRLAEFRDALARTPPDSSPVRPSR